LWLHALSLEPAECIGRVFISRHVPLQGV
jgi:hypothetical protein